jgi:DNA anti-recombination protein RmuC
MTAARSALAAAGGRLGLATVLALGALPALAQTGTGTGEAAGVEAINRNLETMNRHLASIERRLAELQQTAQQQAARDAERLRTERATLERILQASQGTLDRTVARERAAVDEMVMRERSRLVEFVDVQRAALTADGERIARDLSGLWLDRTQSIVRNTAIALALLLLAIVAASVGLGWLIGRALQVRAARRG